MFFNFGFNNDIENCVLEIKIGNQIQKQMLSGLQEMIQMQFMQMMKEVSENQQPIRIRLIRNDEIWNQYEKKIKKLENYIQFANKPYMEAFKSEFE